MLELDEASEYRVRIGNLKATALGLCGKRSLNAGIPVDQCSVDIEGDPIDFCGDWHCA